MLVPTQVVRCLLIEPFPESALNEEAGKMLMEDYEGYAKHARYLFCSVLSFFSLELSSADTFPSYHSTYVYAVVSMCLL